MAEEDLLDRLKQYESTVKEALKNARDRKASTWTMQGSVANRTEIRAYESAIKNLYKFVPELKTGYTKEELTESSVPVNNIPPHRRGKRSDPDPPRYKY